MKPIQHLADTPRVYVHRLGDELMCPGPSDCEPSMSASFIGTWRLVSYVMIDPTGSPRPYWDDHPIGQLIYTADGHMSAQVYDARRSALQVEPEAATAES